MKNFLSEYLTIILIIIAAGFATWASIRQYIDNNNITKENKALQIKIASLQQEQLNYLGGTDDVPALTANIFGDYIKIIIVNPNEKYPMLNVVFRQDNNSSHELGTLYPEVVNQLAIISFNKKIKKTQFYSFVIWFSNTKSINVQIELFWSKNNGFEIKTKYMNGNEEYIPKWKTEPEIKRRKLLNANKSNVFDPKIHRD